MIMTDNFKNWQRKTEISPSLCKILGEDLGQLTPPVLDNFRDSLVSFFKKSKAKSNARTKWKGWEVTSDVFPSNGRQGISPKSDGKGIIRPGNKKFLDIFKFSLNSLTTKNSLPNLDDVEKSNSDKFSDFETSNDNSLKLSVYQLVDRIAEYFQFVSASSFLILLVYLDRFFALHPRKYFTSTKWAKRWVKILSLFRRREFPYVALPLRFVSSHFYFYRFIFAFFILAVKYNEDFETPDEYILEVAKRMRIFRSQNEVNSWLIELMGSLNNSLFVSLEELEKWWNSLFSLASISGPQPFSLIEDYFEPKSSLMKISQPRYPKSKSQKWVNKCVMLLEGHIFSDNVEFQNYYGSCSTTHTEESVEHLLLQ